MIKAVADDSAAPRKPEPAKPRTSAGYSGYIGDPDHDMKRQAMGLPIVPPNGMVPAGMHYVLPPEKPEPTRKPKGAAMRRLFGG